MDLVSLASNQESENKLSYVVPVTRGIYTVVEDTDGFPKQAYYYSLNLMDGKRIPITEEQKIKLTPLIGNPDVKFIEINGELHASHQVTGITKETDKVKYIVGGTLKLDDYGAALRLSNGEGVRFHLPKGDITWE